MPDQPEIYPMPMFPTLSVTDVAASLEWYANKVGFVSVFNLPVPGGGLAMAHLRWRKYADLLMIPDPDPGPSDRTTPQGRRRILLATRGHDLRGRAGCKPRRPGRGSS